MDYTIVFALLSLLFLFSVTTANNTTPAPGPCRHPKHNYFTCIDDPSNTLVEGIMPSLLDRFRHISQFATATYCPDNNDSPHTLLSCPAGTCQWVEAANVSTTTEFENNLQTDTTGYVAIDNVHHYIVLAFRGSRSEANWVVDLEANKVPSDLCSNCHAHHGFWNSWMDVRYKVLQALDEAVHAHPEYRVIVVGHSLGGALATLAAGSIRNRSAHLLQVTELYTFGSPRVGSYQTAKFLSEQSTLSYRVTLKSDPVPRAPGIVLDYMHTSPEYWIKENPANPKPEDVWLLTGYYNSKGNSGTHDWSRKYHKLYFGTISTCAKKEHDWSFSVWPW